jgi:predicted Zn-dependent protease
MLLGGTIMPKTTKTAARNVKSSAGDAVIARTRAEKSLAKAPEDKVFWSNDGRILTDMKDLMEALANMSDQNFAYHSNALKKDFSNWVRDILEDEKLAEDLEKAANREQAATVVEERYEFLKSKVEK